jgi:anti-anti-sigma factor
MRAARADTFQKVERRKGMATDATAPAQELKIEIRKAPEEIVFLCTGRINSATSAELKSTVQPLISETKRIVVDLTGVNYIDSSGIGGLVSLWVSSKKAGCQLKLVNLSERLKELLRITNLTKVFEGDMEYLGM